MTPAPASSSPDTCGVWATYLNEQNAVETPALPQASKTSMPDLSRPSSRESPIPNGMLAETVSFKDRFLLGEIEKTNQYSEDIRQVKENKDTQEGI